MTFLVITVRKTYPPNPPPPNPQQCFVVVVAYGSSNINRKKYLKLFSVNNISVMLPKAANDFVQLYFKKISNEQQGFF